MENSWDSRILILNCPGLRDVSGFICLQTSLRELENRDGGSIVGTKNNSFSRSELFPKASALTGAFNHLQ